MSTDSACLSYEETSYFSKMVIDYLHESPQLKQFYNHPLSLEGIKHSIQKRQTFPTNRKLLADSLLIQYKGLNLTKVVTDNIEKLNSDNSFTVVTAHQPNIFTGPLYVIYKIMHTIKLAAFLQQQFPENNFIPVYYMGSEDADLDELGKISLDGKKITWNTSQTGAVGRMTVDKPLLALIQEISGQIDVLPFGKSLTKIFSDSYTLGKTIQQATLELIHTLFGEYGLLVLIPDNAALKKSFHSVVKKELLEQFSHKAVLETNKAISEHYKIQAAGRDLNLFYLLNNKRERITKNNDSYTVEALSLNFTEQAILQELETYPERFSANVILRGVFQETILPNIAFIGGGGELAYWLELKKVFEAVNVPYPMLILRNSFALIEPHQQKIMQKLSLNNHLLFKPTHEILNELVKRSSQTPLDLQAEIAELKKVFFSVKHISQQADITLKEHSEALETKALKPLFELEKKMLRAARKKQVTATNQVSKLKAALFPNGSLQERVENFAIPYAKHGSNWLSQLFEASPSLGMQFTLLYLPE